VPGLDEVLCGGLTKDRLYLLEGTPGTGKTTVALQFLIEGARRGEKCLCITLSETEDELREVARSHGWSLDGVTIRENIPSERDLAPDEQNTMFHPSHVEMSAMVQALLRDIEEIRPARLVIDSVSELRLLAGSLLEYRRQFLALKRCFREARSTVLLLDDITGREMQDMHLQSIVHGVLRLEGIAQEYGGERRRLRVIKFRGTRFRDGHHDYVIRRGGLRAYPRVVASEHRHSLPLRKLSSGIEGLDQLLGGGVEGGTSTLLVGAAGTGKSSLAALFAAAAADRGEQAALFIFDESVATLLTRTTGLGIDLRKHVEKGRVTIQPVDPAELSPGEFAHAIRNMVEQHGVSIVVIDSLNGYLNAMPGERFVIIQLHELLMYLGQAGVATLLTGTHQGLVGNQLKTPVDASYLADTVVLLRYFEARGEIRKAISVVKKRGGAHERTIREFSLENGRMRIGEPLRKFRGVLTGVPVLEGPRAEIGEGTQG